MNKKDLKAILLASALSGAAFTIPVIAEETAVDPVDVQDQTTETVDNTVVVDSKQEISQEDTNTNEDISQDESVLPVETLNGWSQDGNFYYENNEKVINDFRTIDGKTYYFNEMGYKTYGIVWVQDDYYSFDDNGVMEMNIEKNDYYFGNDGKALRNTWKQFPNGKYRYYDNSCIYYRGYNDFSEYEIDGKYYAFDSDGYMITGWKQNYGSWYYYKKDGSKANNEWVDDTYYVNEYGVMCTNQWVNDFTYVGNDGKKTKNTWEYKSGIWKYKLGNDAYAKSILLNIDGKYYAFDYTGAMVVNGVEHVNLPGASWTGGFVYAKNGTLQKGWYKNEFDEYQYFGDDYFAYEYGLSEIGGKQYYFENAVMAKSKTFVYDGKLYKADGTGACTLITSSTNDGWNNIQGQWYYIKNGKALTDTIENIGGNNYYFSPTGCNIKNQTFEYKGNKYYANGDGVVINAKNTWYQDVYGRWYYFNENGCLVTSSLFTIGSNKYSFSSDGQVQTGVVYVYQDGQQSCYYANKDGVIQQTPGWKYNNFQWYYCKQNGSLMINDWLKENGKEYYFDSNGCMVASEVKKIDGCIYYFNTDGVMKESTESFKGWKKIHGQWYYCPEKGEMYYSGKVGDYYVFNGQMQVDSIVDEKYYVGHDGKIKKGWIFTNGNWQYADPTTGILVKYQWKKIDNQWYYFDYSMAKGYWTIEGELNKFTENGVWQGACGKNKWLQDPATKRWLYVKKNGTLNYESKVKIDGKTYYFTAYVKGGTMGNCYLSENTIWYDYSNNVWLWTNSTGTGIDKSTGWKKSNDGIHAYVENGKLVTGLKTINGRTYYFLYDGTLAIGVNNYKGKAYVTDLNGNLVNYTEGWNRYNGQWFYIKNGLALTDTVIDGYYIGREGLTVTGIVYENNSDGTSNVLAVQGKLAKNQWVKVYNNWYYADAKGHMIKNQWLGNYYFDNNGRMVTNAWIDNYYVGADGLYHPAKWMQTNGKYWYRRSDGSYTKNNFEKINGQWYYFDANGYMITGWKELSGEWYYFNGSGCMVKNQWVGSYYFESNGVMAKNKWIGNYHVGADGKWDKTK